MTTITGSGPGGRVTKSDLQTALDAKTDIVRVLDRGTVGSGTTLILDVTVNRVQKVLLTGNITLQVTTATAPLAYVNAILEITQDGNGSRTITFPNNIRWQGGFSPSLSVAPGATDVLQMMTFDGGTTWLAAIALQVAP